MRILKNLWEIFYYFITAFLIFLSPFTIIAPIAYFIIPQKLFLIFLKITLITGLFISINITYQSYKK